MPVFNDMLQEDAGAFLDLDAMAETVTYKPKVGSSVSIKAIVFREVPEPLEANSRAERQGHVPNIVVAIRNHATLGRTSIDAGGDKISVSRKYGGTAEDFSVAVILEQDAGMWKLRLR